MPGDDTQGFDWQGLLKSATPYAAALIPAVIGGLAGGRLGGGALGAAGGFTSGMAGEQRAQDQYQQEAVRVQQANQQAQRQQQQAQYQQQEIALRQQNYDQQQRHLEAESTHLEAETRRLNQQVDEAQATKQARKNFSDLYLQGARKAAYDAADPKEQDRMMEDYKQEQLDAAARPGLIKGLGTFGVSPDIVANTPTKELSQAYFHLMGQRQRALDRPADRLSPMTLTGPDGNPVIVGYDPKTNQARPVDMSQLPPGTIPSKPTKPVSADKIQAFKNKEFMQQGGYRNAAQVGPQDRDNWELSQLGELASQRGNNEITQQQYDQGKRDFMLSHPDKVNALADHRARNEYEENPQKVPSGIFRTQVEQPYEDYVKTPKGQALLAGHKADIIKELGAEPTEPTPPAPPPTGKPAPAGKPAAKPATRGAAEAATAPAVAPTGFADLPPAKDWANKQMRDTQTGDLWKSDGSKWTKVK